MKQQKQTKTLYSKVNPEIHKKLKLYAYRNDLTMNELLEKIILNYVEEQEKKQKNVIKD